MMPHTKDLLTPGQNGEPNTADDSYGPMTYDAQMKPDPSVSTRLDPDVKRSLDHGMELNRQPTREAMECAILCWAAYGYPRPSELPKPRGNSTVTRCVVKTAR
jgi:hypothetical protein